MANSSRTQPHGINAYSDALRLQATVIFALILRETRTTFGNSKIGYLWALLEPLAFLSLFVFIFSLIGRKSPLPGDMAYFFLTGLAPFLMFQKIVTKTMNAESGNRALMTYPQVTTFDVKMARVILETCLTFLTLSILFLVFPLVGLTHVKLGSITHMIIALLSFSSFALSIGLINAFIMNYWESYQTFYTLVVNRPLFYTSGLFFLPEQIPMPYQHYLSFNPILQFIAWFRESTYADFDSIFGYSQNLIILTLTTLFIGLALERVGQYKKLAA